ncbi:MAG: hypothetical protein GY842_13770 [bacterium]|nr:hypothetical protein [bacterium]
MTPQSAQLHQHLRLTDRLVVLTAWCAAIALFVTVGWRALQPIDPQGAVSMLTTRSPGLMIVQVGALGLVVAALASLLTGRKLADAGVFATCLGLAVANLRADTLGALLIGASDGDAIVPVRQIALSFLLESILWAAVVLAAMLVSGWVLYWCRGDAGARPAVLSGMACTEMPLVSSTLGAAPSSEGTSDERRTGMLHTLATSAIAFLLVGVFSTGSPPPAIQHGQVYFAIAAAFCAAGYLANGRFPVRTVFWTWLAVPIVTVGAYLWAMLGAGGDVSHLPPSIPQSAYLRALPLEYIALGTLGSVLAFWWTRQAYAAHEVRAHNHKRKPQRRR